MSVYNRAISRENQRVFGQEITNQPMYVPLSQKNKIKMSNEKKGIVSQKEKTTSCPKHVKEFATDIYTYLHGIENIRP